MRKVSVAIQLGGHPDLAGFEPALVAIDRGEMERMRTVGKRKGDLVQQLCVSALDGEVVLGATLVHKLAGPLALGEQGLGPDRFAEALDGLPQRDGCFSFHWAASPHRALLPAAYPLFWGVPLGTLLSEHAHDRGLAPVRITGVAHGFALDRQALVDGAIVGIQALARAIQVGRIDSNPHVPTEAVAGHEILSIANPAAKPGTRFWA